MTDTESAAEENLATLRDGAKLSYDDRTIATLEGGFVQQHTLFVMHPDDFVGQMDVRFIAYVRDGMISRTYEYFDTGQMDIFLGPSRRG